MSCKNCDAEAWAKRVGQKVWGINAPQRFFSDTHWAAPLKWNRRLEASRDRLPMSAQRFGGFPDGIDAVGLDSVWGWKTWHHKSPAGNGPDVFWQTLVAS